MRNGPAYLTTSFGITIRDSVIDCVCSRPVISDIVFLESTRIPTESLLWNHVVVLSFLRRQLHMWDSLIDKLQSHALY